MQSQAYCFDFFLKFILGVFTVSGRSIVSNVHMSVKTCSSGEWCTIYKIKIDLTKKIVKMSSKSEKRVTGEYHNKNALNLNDKQNKQNDTQILIKLFNIS